MIDETRLYGWQRTASQAWSVRKHGIVLSATGTGKSVFALYCMSMTRKRTIILCPTIALMRQWKDEILKNLGIEPDKVGLYYSAKKDIRPITVAVVNSVRGIDLSGFEMMVADEIDTMASYENIKVLSQPVPIKLGLSATLDPPQKRMLEPVFGEVVFEYTVQQAKRDGILNQFEILNIATELDSATKEQYKALSKNISLTLKRFNGDFLAVKRVASDYRHPLSRDAQQLLRDVMARRMLCANYKGKIEELLTILADHKTDRVIIFNEYLEMAESVNHILHGCGYRVGVYHSKSKNKQTIEDFRDGNLDILVAVRSLNRGLNVPDANIGIILSGDNIRRTAIQRLGRIVRKVEGKKAYLYQIYCKATCEEQTASKRTSWLD